MSGFATARAARRSTVARAADGVGGLDGQLDPAADADAVTPSIPRWPQAALDRPALRIEDAGLRHDVDGEPEAGSSGDDVLLRGSARSCRR